MEKVNRKSERHTAFALTEEAIALLRGASAGTLVCYYLGAIPFWLTLQFFIADMSHNGFASERLASGALEVALGFIWMKCWQTVYASKLHSSLLLEPDRGWDAGRIYRMVLQQTAIQSWGLVIRILAYTVLLPFVWVSSFYQNATILGNGEKRAGPSVASLSWRQAVLWVRQAHLLAFVLSVFSFFVWINVLIALLLPPLFAKAFLGIESVASRDMGAYVNTTFFTATWALACLCVDPIWRAAYVLRCFYGQSLATGDDLRLQLRNLKARTAQTALTIAILGLVCPPAHGQSLPRVANAVVPFAFAEASKAPSAQVLPSPPPANPQSHVDIPSTVAPERLNRSIDEVLSRRDYTWRTPRAETKEHKSFIAAWIEDVFKMAKSTASAVRHFWKSLWERIFPPTDRSPSHHESGSFQVPWRAILYLLLAAGVILLGWMLLRFRFGKKRPVITAEAVHAMPDLHSEDVMADQLPEDGWLDLARQLMERGELRLALRAAYLSGLAHLGQRELLTIAKHKSNRDYDRELRRRARSRAELLAAFEDNLGDFERSWYGRHEVTSDLFAHFTQNLERIRAC